MKRIRVELIYHVSDIENETLFADRIVDYIKQWRDPEKSRNEPTPHYETCAVSVETCKFVPVVTDGKKGKGR